MNVNLQQEILHVSLKKLFKMKKVIILCMLAFTCGVLPAQENKKFTKVTLKEVPELTGHKWSIGISAGGSLNGYGKNLEKVLIDEGYNKIHKGGGIFFSPFEDSYPRTSKSLSFSIDINRWINKYFTLSLNVDKNGRNIQGYNGFEFLGFDYKLFTFTPLVKFTPEEYFFLGIGPTYCNASDIGGENLLSFEKFGFSLYLSVRSNRNTGRMFGYLDFKYNFLGNYIIGTKSRLPETKINFNNVYIGIGLGFRL